jgi:sugar O-acyltransferase (sialic acid O-acetyltransferase NeuD family)
MTSAEGVFVFGASGHAKVVIDAIERDGRNRVLFVYDDAKHKHGGCLMGYPIVGGREELLARKRETHVGIVGIGDNAARMRVASWLVEHECELTRVVHPGASIAREVDIEDGTVVMAGCVINTGTRVGRNVIVNTGATVDHDCAVDEGVHVGPGSHLCGHVSIGARTLIGAGTTVIPGVRIGSDAVIGAGSTVLGDVPDGARAGGTPCRILVEPK